MLEIQDAGDDSRMVQSKLSSTKNEEPDVRPSFEEPISYRIHRKTQDDRREYKIYEMKEREFMSANGGWRPLAKGLHFFWKKSRIILLILVIIIVDIVNPYGVMNPIFSKIIQPNSLFIKIFIYVVIPIALIPVVLILTTIINLLDVSIFTVQDPNKSSLGEIRGNVPLFGRINWKVQGCTKENQAFVKLPGFMVLDRSELTFFHIGRIETPFGLFKAKVPLERFPGGEYENNYMPARCEITDSNNSLWFTVTWSKHKLFSTSDMEYIIDSPNPLSPFLTFTISVCLIEKFLNRYEVYDYYQNSTNGLPIQEN